MKYFLISLLFLCLISGSNISQAKKGNHLPVVLPMSVIGIGNFIGIGYGFIDMLDETDFTAIGYIGDLTGASLVISDLNLAKDWLYFDGYYLYTDNFTPQVNYSRGSKEAPVVYSPRTKSHLLELSLTFKPLDGLFLRLAPGGTQSNFKGFYSKSGKDGIDILSMDNINLETRYLKTELVGTYNITGKKSTAKTYISGGVRTINQQKNILYSANFITSYMLSGQIKIYPNLAFLMEYFHSDANVEEQEDTGYKNPFNFSCSTGGGYCNSLNSVTTSYLSRDRKYGSAEPLGGPERMKAYPINYFTGAHSRYLTMKIRFEEGNSGNQLIAASQIFTEFGSVSDEIEQLEDSIVFSSGVEMVMEVNEYFEYNITLANGNNGLLSSLSLTRRW